MIKIMFYNWTLIDGKNGGGVTVYLKNLIKSLVKDSNYIITYVNSGLHYDKSWVTRIEQVKNSLGVNIRTYEIVNSPVIAPIEQSAKNLSIYLSDQLLKKQLLDFIEYEGPFDIIHFHNIEGLSLNVLELKERYPETKLLYTLHNYFPFCSKVNLWQGISGSNHHNCCKKDYCECAKCYKHTSYYFEKIYRVCPSFFSKGIKKIANSVYNNNGNPELYELYEKKNVEYINKYIDCVFAVSNRVRDIAIEHGLIENKVKLLYIGTEVADKACYKSNTGIIEDNLVISYMGYMECEKGFYFFLDALERIPENYSKNISVRIIARHNKNKKRKEIARLTDLKKRYRSIELINGYTHENQQTLLDGVNLGVVPVLWEDNLPQVAIEQIAYGVPILVSDLGGAKELFNDHRFVFKAGSLDDFIQKIISIYNNPVWLDEFWESVKPLKRMQDHINELHAYYKVESNRCST